MTHIFIYCRYKMRTAGLLAMMVFMLNCLQVSAENHAVNSIGLFGRVVLREGDCMPSVDSLSCRLIPVRRKVYIHQRLSRKDMGSAVDGDGEYLRKENSPLVTVETDEQGRYSVNLSRGVYSVFVEDAGREYCNNLFDDGSACPVTVEDRPVEYNITINHATD